MSSTLSASDPTPSTNALPGALRHGSTSRNGKSMISIEIGPVPQAETPPMDGIGGLLAVAVFLRQLNRVRPVLPESGLRYVAQVTTQRATGFTVILTGMPGSWKEADLAHDLAIAALEIQHWDETALDELDRSGQLTGRTRTLAPIAA